MNCRIRLLVRKTEISPLLYVEVVPHRVLLHEQVVVVTAHKQVFINKATDTKYAQNSSLSWLASLLVFLSTGQTQFYLYI